MINDSAKSTIDEQNEEEELSLPSPLVTSDMILSVNWEAILAQVANEDDYAIEQQLRKAANEAREAGDISDAQTLELFAAIMSIAVRPDDDQNPFGAKLIMDGRRSMVPDDIVGEQSAVLADIVDRLPNIHIRARVGDVVFYNSRSHFEAAKAAISAYCAVAEGRLDDTIKPRWPDRAFSIRDVVAPLARAIALTRLTEKRMVTPTIVSDTLVACYEAAKLGSHYMAFVEISQLGLLQGILKPEAVAADAEALAINAPVDEYPQAVKRVWIIAADCHERLGAKDESARCRMNAAEQTLKMRDQSDQPSVKAHWTKAALGEMRSIPNTYGRVKQLREELKAFQLAAHDEFSTFKTPIDLTELIANTEKLFEAISFSDACVHFYNMTAAPSKEELCSIVLNLAKKNPLSASIASSFYDEEGRETARVEAAPFDGDPSEDWYRAESIRYMDIVIQQQVRGKIEPARISLASRISIQERHLLPITKASMFVPPTRAPLYALGFARMFQGDYATAAHLLFPQLENSIRHIMMMSNHDPSKIEQDLIQGDRTLSALIASNKAELEHIFGTDIIYQIDILFNFKPGPALRNEMAHGKLPWGAFFHHANIFACWFIFGLTCLPLFDVWSEQMAPLLNEEASEF
jgi:hypothetical protein